LWWICRRGKIRPDDNLRPQRAQRGGGKTGPNALHTGASVVVNFLAAHDGQSLGFLKPVTNADGCVIQISGGSRSD
jgi:hypothetical protein